MNGVQDAGDVLAIAIEDFGVGVGRRARYERPRHLDVALAQRNDGIVHGLLPLGLRNQREQRVGHAAARRQHDAEARPFSLSMMSATRWMHAASATLEPPNL